VLLQEYVDVVAVVDLPSGAATFVEVGEREIGVWNLGGRFYAMDNICPHQGAQLHEGWVRDGCVTCPWHAWSYRLATGAMEMGDSVDRLDTFETRVDQGRVYVRRTPRT
jgi:nitrite reductase (NADH) small subunit/3-phenylpropionate/trans-cinnamate dioxygenase ferredoxin subunit